VSPVRLTFNVSAINSIDVASNWLYMTGGPASVVCINLDKPTQVTDIVIPRKLSESAGTIRQIYASASGQALLAVTSKNEHFYYHQRNQARPEFKHLQKLRGTSTICASFHPSKSNTFLLGTRAGNIVEVGVDSSANETYFKRDLKFASQVWKSPHKDPVTSLIVVLDSKKQPQVLATCGKNVYRWTFDYASNRSGVSYFQELFEASPEEVAQGKSPHNLICSPDGEHWGLILSNHAISIADAKQGVFHEVELEKPEKLLISNYYALVVVATNTGLAICAINLFDYKKTEFPMSESHISGIAIDRTMKTYWLHSEDTLLEVKVENEQSGMWKSLASQQKFEDALAIAESRPQKSIVLTMEAQHEMAESNFEKAASLFGASDAPLEVVALDLMRKTENDSSVICALLLARLKRTHSPAQQTMLTAWLAELGNYSWVTTKVSWDIDLVCQSLKKRAKFDELVSLLSETNVEAAISVLVSTEQYKSALDLLRQHELLPSVYHYAAILLDNEPRATVESWMRISGLDYTRLVPVALRYAQKYRGPAEENQALRFLKFVIQKPQIQLSSVFNAIVVILAPQKSGELLEFLQHYAPKLDDLDFSLRVCLKYKQIESAVYLATQMELFEEAVQLCLNAKMYEKAVEIADKETVSGPRNSTSNNEELRKILLREVAQKLIQVEGPQAAVRFTKLLRVDDLLSQFPDFDTLNELAPEIVKSLEQTNARLSSLDAEINESLSASETMQRELQDFKKKPVLVEPGEACQLCDFPLLTRKFVVFPCQHGFHVDCIKTASPKNVTEECVLCSVDNLRQLEMPLNSVF